MNLRMGSVKLMLKRSCEGVHTQTTLDQWPTNNQSLTPSLSFRTASANRCLCFNINECYGFVLFLFVS